MEIKDLETIDQMKGVTIASGQTMDVLGTLRHGPNTITTIIEVVSLDGHMMVKLCVCIVVVEDTFVRLSGGIPAVISAMTTQIFNAQW